MAEFDAIVVPVDGSPAAGRAAAFGARLAAALQCQVRLIYVFPATAMAVIGLSRMTPEEIKQAQNNAARDIFAQARAAMTDGTAQVEELVLLGDPAAELLDYLGRHPKTLVVMGRRGLSPLQTLVMGSVSEKLARHAEVPVTLVH